MPRAARRIGVIGSGAIGGELVRRLLEGVVQGCELVGVLVRRRIDELPRPLEKTSIEELLAESPDTVVEAAGHAAVSSYGESVLRSGTDLVCVSVGALAERSVRDRLVQAALESGARLVVPSGAVGALDALAAAARGGLHHVSVEQRKPPAALLGVDEREIRHPRVLFDGSAAEAARRFPTTMNIVAAVALAGVGFEKTSCRVIADPALSGAEVVVDARGSFGRFTFSMQSKPSPNPRTSAITAMSVAAVLENLSGPTVVPG